jgi:hypothetical protein
MRSTSCRWVLGLCAGVLACLAPAGCGGDAKERPATTRPIDKARGVGERPHAKASATVRKPEALAIYVSAAPKQRVAVVWALSCTNDKDKNEQTSGGTYTAMTPNTRQITVPPSPRDICAFEATSRILTGRVKTTLLAKAP